MRGKTYYFCCAGCKEKFSADPAKYLTPKTLVGIAPMSAHPVQIAPAAAHGASQPVVKIARDPGGRAQSCVERIHLPNGSRSAPARSGRLPEVRDGTGTSRCCASRDQDRIHLPDASGNRAGRAWVLPDLRNGAGAENGQRGGGAKSRTCEYDPQILGLCGAHDSDSGCGHGGYRAWAFGADAVRFAKGLAVARIHPRDSGGFVGRLAVFCARRAIARHSQFEYVYADRFGNRRGIRIQRRGRAVSRNFPVVLSRRRRRSCRVF